jgi:hypothetical protein
MTPAMFVEMLSYTSLGVIFFSPVISPFIVTVLVVRSQNSEIRMREPATKFVETREAEP